MTPNAAKLVLLAKYPDRWTEWFQRNEVLALLAEVQASRQRWQPMESAPKDGTTVVLALRSLGTVYVVTGWWDTEYHRWAGGWSHYDALVGWMPLPAPPSEDRP